MKRERVRALERLERLPTSIVRPMARIMHVAGEITPWCSYAAAAYLTGNPTFTRECIPQHLTLLIEMHGAPDPLELLLFTHSRVGAGVIGSVGLEGRTVVCDVAQNLTGHTLLTDDTVDFYVTIPFLPYRRRYAKSLGGRGDRWNVYAQPHDAHDVTNHFEIKGTYYLTLATLEPGEMDRVS